MISGGGGQHEPKRDTESVLCYFRFGPVSGVTVGILCVCVCRVRLYMLVDVRTCLLMGACTRLYAVS